MMRRWLCLLPLTACGCSTAPVADAYDILFPIAPAKSASVDAPLLPAMPTLPPAAPVDPNAPPPPKW
jgi:hypothetical protein